jgi:hypothetical protein
MFSVKIGLGTPVSGTFASINWGTNAKFMQVELDPAGGSSFIDMGTSQLMSVPYSMHSMYSMNSNNGFPTGTTGDVMYHNGTNWVKLPAGIDGQFLVMNSGVPTWGGCYVATGMITGVSVVCASSSITMSNTTAGGVWSSNNTSIATVNSAGIVTGVAAGTTTISYTRTIACGSATATRVVTVNPLPSAGTITGTATVGVGNTTTLSNITTGGTWSSSASGVATIGSTGVVTGVAAGVAAGVATISYTVTNDCGSAVATRVVTVNLTIGTTYGGGKIAYIFQPSDPGYVAGETHGLIATPSDLSTGIPWGCNGTLVGGTSTALGTGAANTAAIVSACSTTTIAARLCADLVLNGYSDWYLPSKDELYKLYQNSSAIGGFTTGTYWTSSENSANYTWSMYYFGGSDAFPKTVSYYVRAVRTF